MEVINSSSNQKIKKYSKLLQKKYRDIENMFLIEGEHLVEEAYKKNLLIEVFQTEDYPKKYDVSTTYVTYDVLKKLSTSVTPQKIVGVAKKNENTLKGSKYLLLDDIQDPGNLGTIIRSAVAFNIDTIVLSLNTVDCYNDKVIRASQGLIFSINIVREDLKNVITKLKNDGILIYGTSVSQGTSVDNVSNNTPYALIMGNEGRGLTKELEAYCDTMLNIKMRKKCESLNVAVATSILLYELDKR